DRELAEGVSDKDIDDEYREGHRREYAAQDQHLSEWRSGRRLDKLRQERKKEDGELGVEDVQKKSPDHESHRGIRRRRAPDGKRALISPCDERQIEQVQDARELESLKSNSARMHDRRQSQNGGQQVRHDTCGTS